MKKQPVFEAITQLRAVHTNDFRAYTRCIEKYVGKTDPFLRWKLEHLEDDSLCRVLYDLEEEMSYYEQEHGYQPNKPMELTMLKREFNKRTGQEWDEVYIDFEEIRYGGYASIHSYTTRELKIIEDQYSGYDCTDGFNTDDFKI
ncbi:hypothetical protein [uncultured Pontibacter sp.]|uniref:hypothetical protein n=1 Tax=uncultured Pontibacter sp. TaxID=453356 RepID=UPI0026028D77|nr:hypothetical protein [uncultured Pontibacter sp.]